MIVAENLQTIYETIDEMTPVQREQVRFYLEHGRSMTEREAAEWALKDILVASSEPDDAVEEEIDEDALMAEIEDGFRGTRPLSEIIIEERDTQQ